MALLVAEQQILPGREFQGQLAALAGLEIAELLEVGR